MPKTIIYVAVVEHMSEMDVYTDVTEEGLERQVAAYCRGRWDTTSRAVSGCKRPPPDDNKACIDLYFEDHETDLLTTRVSSVGITLPAAGDRGILPGVRRVLGEIRRHVWK